MGESRNRNFSRGKSGDSRMNQLGSERREGNARPSTPLGGLSQGAEIFKKTLNRREALPWSWEGYRKGYRKEERPLYLQWDREQGFYGLRKGGGEQRD